MIAVAAGLFLASGQVAWTWAWVYLGIGLATTLVNGPILLRRRPETVAERGRLEPEKGWDRAVSDDRGHAVCTTGPHRLVRHPGHAGFILQAIPTPWLPGSRRALVPGIAGEGPPRWQD